MVRRPRDSRIVRNFNRRAIRDFFSIAIPLVLAVTFWCQVYRCLRPAVETIAQSNAVNRTMVLMDTAVLDCVVEYDLDYSDFISFTTDNMGQITSITSDLASVSLLKAKVAGYVTEELQGLKEERFGVPLGTLTGWSILWGRGPTVRVKLLSVSDVRVEMRHEFSGGGINQTLHQVYLDLSTAMHLMIPGEILTAQAQTSVCVAETIIVGDVPETYLYVGNGEVEHG